MPITIAPPATPKRRPIVTGKTEKGIPFQYDPNWTKDIRLPGESAFKGGYQVGDGKYFKGKKTMETA